MDKDKKNKEYIERRDEDEIRRTKDINSKLASDKRTKQSTGRRKVDEQASLIHTVTLSIVLTLLALQGIAVTLHYFIPTIFEQ